MDVDSFVKDRIKSFAIIKDTLIVAQEHVKFFMDKKRSDRTFVVGDWVLTFVVGDWVFLHLQPYH